MNKTVLIIFGVCSAVLFLIICLVTVQYLGNTSRNSNNSLTPTITPTISASGCKAGGCSGQLCIESNEEGVSTCEYTAEYACYKTAKCERQTDGKCGWTQTNELKLCVAKANSK